IDRLYGWRAGTCGSVQEGLKRQASGTSDEFHMRWTRVRVQFAELGLNTGLYWELGRGEKKDISVVPVSALTGEGVSDLILLLATFCQRFLPNRLAVKPGPLICRVLEVRETVGMGVCVDVILVQG
ncbi:translation initiation factor if-2, putative, partial [Perkinsus marinus ATCC 50983]